jgi:hypothetical protein
VKISRCGSKPIVFDLIFMKIIVIFRSLGIYVVFWLIPLFSKTGLNMLEHLPTVLVTTANVLDSSNKQAYLKGLKKEMDAIGVALKPLVDKNQIRLEKIFEVSLDDLFESFNDRYSFKNVQVFHFGGHSSQVDITIGKDTSSETGTSGNSEVSAEGFAEFIGNQQGIKLVFLNSCSSEGIATEILKKGIPFVVGTTSEVRDDDAVVFAEYFYKALAAGKSVRASFKQVHTLLSESPGKLKGNYRSFRKSKEQSGVLWQLFCGDEDTKESWKLAPQSVLEKITQSDQVKILCVYPNQIEDKPYFEAIKNTIAKKKEISVKSNWEFINREDFINSLEYFDSIVLFASNNFYPFWNEYLNEEFFLEALNSKRIGIVDCNGSIDSIIETLKEKNVDVSEVIRFPHHPVLTLERLKLMGESDFQITIDGMNDELSPLLEKYGQLSLTKIENVLSYAVKQLNFDEQRKKFTEENSFSQFNLILIEGTENCAHELLVKRIISYKTQIKLSKSHYSNIALWQYFGQDEEVDALDFWSILANEVIKDKRLGRRPNPDEIFQKILEKLINRDIILIFDGLDVRLGSSFKSFWEDFISFIPRPLSESYHTMIIFGLHKNYKKEHSTFKDLSLNQCECSKANVLEHIHPLSKSKLKDWHTTFLNELDADDRYKQFDNQLDEIIINPYIKIVTTEIINYWNCSPILINEILSIDPRN